MTDYAAVVDPISTGQEYPAAFAAAGVETIAVLSEAERLPAYQASWHPERFAHVLHVDELGRDGLITRLRELAPNCLIPGSEVGVPLYETLIEHVLPGTGNDPSRAAARRDKWAMAEALRDAGVPHLRQFCSGDPDEIAKWLADEGMADCDLVVKPPASGGTDEVHLVPAGTDWRPLFDRIVGRLNQTGLVNDALLVQEFAEGDEYLVDSYSVDGRHGLVDVCRYGKVRKGDRIGIYDRVDFLSPHDPDAKAVWDYTRRVLDAVGVRNGCGHTEVMLTASGPRLLEIGERPAGGGHQLITKLATGDNHILRTVAHRVRGEFVEGYELQQHVRAAFISAPATGIWTNAEIFDSVGELSTVHATHFPKSTGDPVKETVDLLSYLAWVILAGPDEQAIEADYRRIKELEARIRIDVSPV
jgi:biotin carboxylase